MITKIEIDGFKTFRNFQLEFSPLTVIAGTNSSGKSNLFDALQLLSRLAETDLKTAFSEQRGEASELFTQYEEDWYAEEIFFAVELLVNKKVRDNWGGEDTLKYTRLRYELRLRRAKNERGIEDLFVNHEKLENLKHDDDEWVKLHIPNRSKDFWRPKVPVGRRTKPYISTEDKNGVVTITLPQDGKRGGKETPANAIAQTVLSGINSVDFPHAFAAKEEMRKWQFLQFNPQALREPTRQDLGSKDKITQSGENLAAVLHRIYQTTPYALKAISHKLNNLLPNLTDVNVYDDKANKQFIIKIKSEDGREFSSRVLSEGTLRLLALCIFQYDEEYRGLLCFEEPENGIHPARMSSMAKLLKDLSVDFTDIDMPLRQVIVNTHSPTLVGRIFEIENPQDITVWFSQLGTQIAEKSNKKFKMHITKMLPVESEVKTDKKGRLTLNFPESEKKLALHQLIKYLESSGFDSLISELRQ
jgi:predicted ATPase